MAGFGSHRGRGGVPLGPSTTRFNSEGSTCAFGAYSGSLTKRAFGTLRQRPDSVARMDRPLGSPEQQSRTFWPLGTSDETMWPYLPCTHIVVGAGGSDADMRERSSIFLELGKARPRKARKAVYGGAPAFFLRGRL